MGLYGMTSGQALGQGTFTFDRIAPNRYLLDSRVNNDSVMPGRYALIEYDRPIAVIKNVKLILNTTDNTYELPENFKFEYNIKNKTYDIIPVCEENGKISTVIPDRNTISDLLDNDTTEKIDKFINKQAEEEDLSELGLTEAEIKKLYKYRYAIQTKSKIFICIQTPGQETTYNYFYANIPEQSSEQEQSSVLLTKTDFTLYEPYKGEEEYKPLTPNEFNKIVDEAYIAKDETDDIDLHTFDLWDSTAWIKIIDKEKSEFKYIKIADLNVLTPSFKVDEDPQNEHEPTTTFSDTSGTFNAPSVTQGQNASFIIKFPPPMDIDVTVETTADETGLDTVDARFSDKNTKEFTFKLPSIGNAVASANEVAGDAQDKIDTIDQKIIPLVKNGTWPEKGAQPSYSENNYDVPSDAGAIWQAIGAAYEAAHSANAASSSAQSGLISTIGTDGITVSIGGETKIIEAGTSKKLNIEVTVNDANLITAEEINTMWNEISNINS